MTERPVLIVEREGQARELQAHFLRELGLEVEQVADGETALERVRQLHPVLVVSEILIPRLDGLALCRRIKSASATRDVPVLVTSILSAGGRAREAGADGFLLKPITQERLGHEVERLVSPPRARAEGRA